MLGEYINSPSDYSGQWITLGICLALFNFISVIVYLFLLGDGNLEDVEIDKWEARKLLLVGTLGFLYVPFLFVRWLVFTLWNVIKKADLFGGSE